MSRMPKVGCTHPSTCICQLDSSTTGTKCSSPSQWSRLIPPSISSPTPIWLFQHTYISSHTHFLCFCGSTGRHQDHVGLIPREQMPSPTKFTQVKNNQWIRPVIWIRSRIEWPWAMLHHSINYHENRASHFCLILLTDRQTNSTLVEVINPKIHFSEHSSMSSVSAPALWPWGRLTDSYKSWFRRRRTTLYKNSNIVYEINSVYTHTHTQYCAQV